MGDLTDPIDTIISILSSGSTGLGTTGYEIYEDNGSTSATLLVSYKLSNDELKAAFGGTQDYDVIITVERGEVSDEWIGLATKMWTCPVIVKIHVIDKWSAVATKIITAALVRYKAVNALRKFVKAKQESPGGSIHMWKFKGFTDEEDNTVRPILYKAIVETEIWTYYTG